MQRDPPTFKVIIVGNQSVGKTHILNSFVFGHIPPSIKTTLGVEFQSKTVKDQLSDQSIKLLIFDTAGEEKFHAVTACHFKKAKGCIIVYDVTNRDSFNHLEKWINDAKSLTDSDCILLLIGNKNDVDLKPLNTSGTFLKSNQERQVSLEEGLEMAKKHQISFYEVSAVQNSNINEAFGFLASQMIEQYKIEKIRRQQNSQGIEDERNKNIKLSRRRYDCCISNGRQEDESMGRCC